MLSPRRCLADSSPITQRTASMTFDLPQPLGPTTPVRLLGKLMGVGSTNLLKPAILIFVSRICAFYPPSPAHPKDIKVYVNMTSTPTTQLKTFANPKTRRDDTFP